MKVEYVDHMGSDLTVVNSARVSFDKVSKKFTYKKDMPKGSDEALVQYLAKHNHWTPFSHPQITLKEKVPIFVARQRFKHMIGFTYNEVSRRYVDDPPEFFFPDVWRARPTDGMKQGSSNEPAEDQEGINKAVGKVISACEYLYEAMIKEGVAPEQARMILPQSMYTEYYVTGSLAAFARAYKLRIDSHAQKEIQYLAIEWDRIIRPLYPESWEALTS